MAPRCKTCGTPLDEIPFNDCEEHARYEAAQPVLTDEELNLINDIYCFEDQF